MAGATTALTRVNRAAVRDTGLAPGTLRALLEASAGQPLPDWERVAGSIRLRRIEPGGMVFRQDETHPFVYGVRRGLLKLYYLTADGDEWIKSFAHEGRFFASISALADAGRTSFAVEAIEESTLEQLDYRVLEEQARRQLTWCRAVQALTLVFAARKEQRERELLTLSPQERYLAFSRQQPELERRIPQKDLARHLGMTPVGLNRIIARVRRGQLRASHD